MIEDGVTGRLVPVGDAEALARATEELVQNAGLRSAMGQKAKERAVGRFSAEVIVPRYEALYERVCES